MARARAEVTGKKPAADPAKDDPVKVELLAFSIRQFCQSHNISVDTYFRLQRDGLGPRVMKARHRTLISFEAAADWRRAREKAAAESDRQATA